MAKLESRTYKGIDYIQLKELPEEQSLELIKWLDKESIITIQVNGNPLKDCVQYTDYSYWYDSVFTASENQENPNKATREGNSYGFAFENRG